MTVARQFSFLDQKLNKKNLCIFVRWLRYDITMPLDTNIIFVKVICIITSEAFRISFFFVVLNFDFGHVTILRIISRLSQSWGRSGEGWRRTVWGQNTHWPQVFNHNWGSWSFMQLFFRSEKRENIKFAAKKTLIKFQKCYYRSF